MPEVEYDKTCFVIMPFGEEGTPDRVQSDRVYNEVIRAAVEEAGLGLCCKRVDEVSHSGFILDDVITYAAKSRFVIADLRGRNANVFYEMGIRHSLRRGTILLAESARDLPFDVAPLRTIMYNDHSQEGIIAARQRLTTFIREMNELTNLDDSPVLRVLGAPSLATSGSPNGADVGSLLSSGPRDSFTEEDLTRETMSHALESRRPRDSEVVVDVFMAMAPSGQIPSLSLLRPALERGLQRFRDALPGYFSALDTKNYRNSVAKYADVGPPEKGYCYYFEFDRRGAFFVRQFIQSEPSNNQLEPTWFSPMVVLTSVLFGLTAGAFLLAELGREGSVATKCRIDGLRGKQPSRLDDLLGYPFRVPFPESSVSEMSFEINETWVRPDSSNVRPTLEKVLTDFLFLLGISDSLDRYVQNAVRSIMGHVGIDSFDVLQKK